MRDTVTSELIRDNLPTFATMFLQESLCSLGITAALKKYINDPTILINGPPQVMLFSLDLHKYFINEECIAISLLLSSQSLGVF
jgi:hypothetical protein